MKEQNKNFLFNVGYQLVMYLFPLITAGYIARVLGAESQGIYAYVSSIVTICGMFCHLGITNYGNREIAKIRDDKSQLSITFSSIYSLQLLLSLGVIVVYIICLCIIPTEYKTLFWIQVIHLISIACDISWLFFGLEKFKVTLTRNFFVKCVSMLLIILFVKGTDDLVKYTIIMCCSSLFSQFFLLYLSRKIVKFRRVSFDNIKPHILPCLVLFIPVIAFNIYRIMDKTMIGLWATKTELAYYENAERIINIPIMVISALGTVMLPHMAHAISNKSEDYEKTIKDSMHLATIIATFSCIGLVIIGTDLSVILFGKNFSYSGVLVGILSSTIIASAWANVIRTQFLIPNSYDKVYVTSTIVGAVINLCFNVVLIKPYGAIGACVGTILAEYSIAIYQTIFVRNILSIKEYILDMAINFAKALVMAIVISSVPYFVSNIYIKVMVQLVIAFILFVTFDFKYLTREFFCIKK